MKLRGGYMPAIPGRPSRVVREIPVPERLTVDLAQAGVAYTPAVDDGAAVSFGAPLAWAEAAGGRIALPAPADGTVALEPSRGDRPGRIRLTVSDSTVRPVSPRFAPERTTAEAMRGAMAGGGLWPLIWSSATRGMPRLDGSEAPARILVNFVLAEPFRTRGKVALESDWEAMAAGLRFLPRLLAEYGTIHLVLTQLSDPAAQRIRRETTGHAWIRIEAVPVRYPVEDPRVLCRALRRGGRGVKPGETLWVLDVQAVQAIGALMGEGIPLHRRIAAVGGPGALAPSHVRARIGTGLDRVLDAAELADNRRVVRGGLFRGEAVAADAAVGYADDAFLVLPRPAGREFLAFMMPGFDRASILPCFASRLTGAADRALTTSLRGERRPCIACGLCEDVCPAGLMPQVLHRYLYRDAIDEAERTGLPLCIGCGLCSYVCPSKIELSHQFAEAQARLLREHEQAAAAEAAHARLEEAQQREKEHSEDWRK